MNYTTRLLHELEGFRGAVYDDATGQPIVPGYTCVGHPTVGYGRALDVCPLSEDESAYLFESQHIAAWNACRRVVPGWDSLTDHRQAVLVAMAYQLGETGLSRFRRMLAAIAEQDWVAAEVEMLDSAAARQTPARYARLRRVWRGEDRIA